MKKNYLFLILLMTYSFASGQVVLTQWNFNSVMPDGSSSTGSATPSSGSGAVALVVATTAVFASGVGSSDPAAVDNTGYNTSGYPAASVGDGTAGIRFAVSTVGYTGIIVKFDTRHSNTASRYLSFEYSSTGISGPWTNAAYFTGSPGDTWYNNRTVDLSSVTSLNNNANAVFRVVTVFESTATGSGVNSYVASTTSSTYGTTGTLRYDMFTVSYTTPLPISLTAFNAKLGDQSTVLSFTTATERNNALFEIERSNDGRTFSKIGEVNGAGDSNTEINYIFTDTKPAKGVNYYRLRQVDFDGASTVGAIRSVIFGKTSSVVLYPTPTTDMMNVRLEESFGTEAQWQVIDLMGRIVSEGIFPAEQTEQHIPVSTFTGGNYILRVTAGQEVLVQTFRKTAQ